MSTGGAARHGGRQPGRGDAGGRLASAAEGCGIRLADGDADRLADLVARVEAGVDEPRALAPPEVSVPAERAHPHNQPAAPPTPAGGGSDSSGWVWRASAADAPPAGGGGPLDGWRLAVKDLVAVAGRPLRCGSLATFDARPEPADAPVVAALRHAGARLAGTTKLHEFAFGTIGIDRAHGLPDNPSAPGRVPGGSSSGAAVVVARGEADLSLGTDTGGSVRIPAALCGVVGLKPGYGALSTAGVVPLAPSLDHVGLLVASAGDLVAPARVLGLVGREVPAPPRRRLGVAAGVGPRCAPEVADAFAGAVERLRRDGWDLVEVDWPTGEEVFAATTAIMYAEAGHGHHRRLVARHHLYGADVRDRLLQGLALRATTYLAARDRQRELRRRCLAVLEGVAGVLTPTVPVPAPAVDEVADPAVAARLVTFTRLADVAGLPAVSVPLPPVVVRRGGTGSGSGGTGLPVGLQIEGSSDAAVVSLAVALAATLSG